MSEARRERVERASSTLLGLCAGTGWFLISAVLLERSDPRATWPLAVLCLGALLFAPMVTNGLRRRIASRLAACDPGARTSWRFLALPALHLLELVPLALAPRSALPRPWGVELLLALGMLAQGHLLVHASRPRAAVACTLIAPAVGLWALAEEPSWLVVLVAPLAVVLALAAGLFLHERACHERLARPGRRDSLVAASTVRSSVWRRQRVLPPIALCLALLSLVLTALLPGLASGRAPHAAAGAGADARSMRASPQAARRAGGGGLGGAHGFGSELSFGSAGVPFGTAIALRAQPLPSSEAFARGPLLLREHVLETFAGDGMRLRAGRPPTVRDAQDGRRDGWCDLEPDAATAARRGERRRLLVEAEPRVLEEWGWTLVFAPRPLVALRVLNVLHAPDAFTVLPWREPAAWTYELEYEHLERPRGALAARRARHPDPRNLQLPPPSAALRRIAREARGVTSGAADDEQRVERLLHHFRTRFAYALDDVGLGGSEAIAAFLDRRAGFCTLFASGMVLMLRELGIASRVAVGYSAHEWSREDRAWVARERDAHAWVEVHWEGIGWLAVDPTPADSRRGAFARYDGEAALSASWTARWLETLRLWKATSGEEVSLGELARLLLAAPASLAPASRWLAAALLAALAFLLIGRRAPRPAPTSGPEPAPGSARARFIEALAARGHRRRPAQTLGELALEAARAEGPALPPLRPAVALLESWRFGGRAATPEGLRQVEEALAALRPRERR